MSARAEVCAEVVHLIQSIAANRDIRRTRADAALLKLVENILSVGTVALDEEQAVAAYDAGSAALDRVLLRIAREADKTYRDGRRDQRGRKAR